MTQPTNLFKNAVAKVRICVANVAELKNIGLATLATLATPLATRKTLINTGVKDICCQCCQSFYRKVKIGN